MIAAGGLLLYSFIRKGKGLANLFYYPKSLKGITLDGITPVMTLGLAVQNTSNQSYTLRSLAGELYVNRNFMGNVSSWIPQTIHPNSETVVDIKIRLSPFAFITDIINGIKNHTFTQALELDAQANIDNLQVPIDVKYKFT